VAGDRHLAGDDVRPPPAAERLERSVDDDRGQDDRRDPVRRRPPPARAAEQGEHGGRTQPDAPVVRGARDPGQEAVEARRVRSRDRGVDRDVQPVGSLHPSAHAGRIV
jgi:hypothetical protein